MGRRKFVRLRKVKYWLQYRLHPSHRYHVVKTGLKPGYSDQDRRMLYACFALLMDYADEEFRCMGGEHESFEAMTEAHIHNMETAPHTWVGLEPGDPRALEQMQDHIDKDKEILALYRWWKYERPQRRWNHVKQGEEDQVMFERLAKVRRALWV